MSKTIRLTRSVGVDLEPLWHACTDAEAMQRWQADRVDGSVTPGSRLTLRWPALRAAVELEVIEVDPMRQLVLSGGDSTLRMRFEPGLLTLEHELEEQPDFVEGMTSSWRVALAHLAHYLDHHAGRDRVTTWFVRPARTSAAMVHGYFTNEVALRSWLTREGSVGSIGSRCSLALAGGLRISGTVLANSEGRDVAVSWEEDGGSLLALRTLPMPTDPSARILTISWSRWQDASPWGDRARDHLHAALERLARVLESGGSA